MEDAAVVPNKKKRIAHPDRRRLDVRNKSNQSLQHSPTANRENVDGKLKFQLLVTKLFFIFN